MITTTFEWCGGLESPPSQMSSVISVPLCEINLLFRSMYGDNGSGQTDTRHF